MIFVIMFMVFFVTMVVIVPPFIIIGISFISSSSFIIGFGFMSFI